MNEIPNHREVINWFEELSQFPSYAENLSEYQRAKILAYSKDQLLRNFRFAVNCMNVRSDNDYPKGVKLEDRLNHIVYNELWDQFQEIIKVLNCLNWNWSIEKSFHKLKESNEVYQDDNSDLEHLLIEQSKNVVNPPSPKGIIEPSPNKNSPDDTQQLKISSYWQSKVNEGEILNQRQIALACFYEGIVISKPNDVCRFAHDLAIFHGHDSGHALYNHYIKIVRLNDRLRGKKPKNAIIDIEKAITVLSDSGKLEAKKDLQKLEEILIEEK
jgi:hypothetical protein